MSYFYKRIHTDECLPTSCTAIFLRKPGVNKPSCLVVLRLNTRILKEPTTKEVDDVIQVSVSRPP